MEEYRQYKEAALQVYIEQKDMRLELRGGAPSFFTKSPLPLVSEPYLKMFSLYRSGVDTDELDSNVDDWEEETIEFFINEEIIPLGDL